MSERTEAEYRALLDQSRAAKFLGGISVRTLEKWRTSGGGPRYSKIGRRVFYSPDRLAEFAQRNEVSNTAEAGAR